MGHDDRARYGSGGPVYGPAEWPKYRKASLEEMLEKRGLDISGKKDELIQRLEQHEGLETDTTDSEEKNKDED